MSKFQKVFVSTMIVISIAVWGFGCDGNQSERQTNSNGQKSEKQAKEEPGTSVDEYREKVEKALNEDLKSSSHPLRKRVEYAHGTVTVKSAYISDIKIITKNGKDRIRKESDIRRVEMNVTNIWDGIFHYNGKTILGITVEDTGDGLNPTGAKIVYTDAIVNVEDPKFWLKAAAVVITVSEALNNQE